MNRIGSARACSGVSNQTTRRATLSVSGLSGIGFIAQSLLERPQVRSKAVAGAEARNPTEERISPYPILPRDPNRRQLIQTRAPPYGARMPGECWSFVALLAFARSPK